MASIKVEMFGGMAPAADTKYLPPNNSVLAVNAWLDSGILTGFYQQKVIAIAPFSPVGKAYRIPLDYDESDIISPSTYLFFANPDTDVVRGAVFGDVHDRYYWASTSGAPQYNTKARIIADDPPWLLGIPPPAVAPDLDVIGGTSPTIVDTAYVVTFVSEYGEEGAPSPPVSGSGPIDAAWTLDLPVPVADDMGVDRNITHKRVYRAVTGSTGVATFFMVEEVVASTTTWVDTTINLGDITGNKILDSTQYTQPPADLVGFCMGQNGILAGWRGSEVWFSEPYRPHAWPVMYVLTVEYPIVGIASIGASFYVMTRGYPVVINGSAPSSLQPVRVTMFEPCTSRGGIVTFPEGVYYPSGNGLILLGAGAAGNVTKPYVTKKAWQQNVRSARFRAGRLQSAYYGFGTVQFGVFQTDTFQTDAFQQEDFLGETSGIYTEPGNDRVALILLESDIAVNNVQNDSWSSELIILKENKVYWLDMADENQPTEPATWHSKDFQLPWKQNFAAVKVYFDALSTSPILDPVRDVAQDQQLDVDKYGIIRWFGDNRLLAVHELRTPGELLRLPSDTKYDFFRFEIETRVDISSVHFANSSKDLRTT